MGSVVMQRNGGRATCYGCCCCCCCKARAAELRSLGAGAPCGRRRSCNVRASMVQRNGGGATCGGHCWNLAVVWGLMRATARKLLPSMGFTCIDRRQSKYEMFLCYYATKAGLGTNVDTCQYPKPEVEKSEIEKAVDKIQGNVPKIEWDFEGIHYFDNGPLTVQYLFVLDALNFCFWPDKDLTYDNLASGLKLALEKDKTALDADRLKNYTGPQLRELLNWPRPLPIEEERVRLLHEVGLELERSFGGSAANLVKSAGNSAASLIELITRHFPGFRDHSLYKGHQVFLYKRAQIFVADLWGAFKGKNFGEFYDIHSITIFADYIVPAVLRELGILKYESNLCCSIDSNSEIVPGSEEEVEIRACSVHAVEKMRELINKKFGKQLLSIDIDLWLWSVGVQNMALSHHRTLSIYY